MAGGDGRTSLTWEFEVRRAVGLHATVCRTLIKLDPVTFAPTPWTDRIREDYAAILGQSARTHREVAGGSPGTGDLRDYAAGPAPVTSPP